MCQKILLIEDDNMFRWRLLHFFEEHGYTILEAEEGFEGIQLAQRYQPDLILCDINMPCFNGYDVLEQIQKNRLTVSIPFVFLTNRDDSEFKTALRAGAADCLSKALSFAQVLERLLSYLPSNHPSKIFPEAKISEVY